MASRAIPSHLKPSAAAGNGEDGGQRHHGKTASHFVSTSVPRPPASSRSICHHRSFLHLSQKESRAAVTAFALLGQMPLRFALMARGGDDTCAKGAPHYIRRISIRVLPGPVCRGSAHRSTLPDPGVAQATCLLRPLWLLRPVIKLCITSHGSFNSQILPLRPLYRTKTNTRRRHGIEACNEPRSNSRTGV